MRSIAYRRHKLECKKKWAAKADYFRGRVPTKVQIGVTANTPALCSCPSCGNPRKHFGNSKLSLTMAELRHMEGTEVDSSSILERCSDG